MSDENGFGLFGGAWIEHVHIGAMGTGAVMTVGAMGDGARGFVGSGDDRGLHGELLELVRELRSSHGPDGRHRRDRRFGAERELGAHGR
ncbi:hypothetical protein AB0A73_27980 [Glycomyces sp. NPDC047369]